MSTSIDESTEQFAKTADALLKEYTERLQGFTKEAFQIADAVMAARAATTKPDGLKRHRLEIQYNVLQQIFSRINTAATNLARVVSQRIEHGKLDELDKAEIMLRLADFEGNLFAAQMAVNTSHPQW